MNGGWHILRYRAVGPPLNFRVPHPCGLCKGAGLTLVAVILDLATIGLYIGSRSIWQMDFSPY